MELKLVSTKSVKIDICMWVLANHRHLFVPTPCMYLNGEGGQGKATVALPHSASRFGHLQGKVLPTEVPFSSTLWKVENEAKIKLKLKTFIPGTKWVFFLIAVNSKLSWPMKGHTTEANTINFLKARPLSKSVPGHFVNLTFRQTTQNCSM